MIYTGLVKTEIGNWNSDGYFHLFTFLAPQNLKRKTLELFCSLNQRLSISPFGRRVLVRFIYFYLFFFFFLGGGGYYEYIYIFEAIL